MIKKITSVLLCVIVMLTCLCIPVSAAGSLPDVSAPYIRFTDMGSDSKALVRIMNNDFCTMRYTIDGTTPTSSSAKFPSEALYVKYPKGGHGAVKVCLKLLVSKKGYNSKIFTYYFGVTNVSGDGITSAPQYVNLTESEAKTTLDNIFAGYENMIKKKETTIERIYSVADFVGSAMGYDYAIVYSGAKGTSSNRTIQLCRALTKGCGVCEEFAQMFSTLCTKVGIDCVIVSSANMNHVWNMVRYNGKWYNVDITNSRMMLSDKDYDESLSGGVYIKDRKIASNALLNYNPLGLTSAPTSSSTYDGNENMITEKLYKYMPETIYLDTGKSICLDYILKDPKKAEYMNYDKSIAAVIKKSGKYYIKAFKTGNTKIAIKTDKETAFITIFVDKRKKSSEFEIMENKYELKVGETRDIRVKNDYTYKGSVSEGPESIYGYKIYDSLELINIVCPSSIIKIKNGYTSYGSIYGVAPGKATIYIVGSSGTVKKVTVTVTK